MSTVEVLSTIQSTNQCSHINAAGRRCRMVIAPTHDSLCAHHLQQQAASQADPETLAAELLDGTGNFNTADRVNALLANTVKQFARQRIDRADALAMGYLAQMLLNTVPGVQKEYQAIRNAEARQALRKSIAESHARRLPGHRAEGDVSSRASSTGTPACAPFAAAQNLAASPSHTSAAPSKDVELSDEALLAVVLQATNPQPRRG